MITEKFSDKVLRWFDQHGRKNLPWQKSISPYRVWISEIMLQQTQVQTVIPYFEAFMARFPTVTRLAAASLDEVLSFWSGLGYYARARNLHLAAKKIEAQWKGVFPGSMEDLSSLPGVGRSTAGAILALSQGKKATILDGNVRRVLCRFHAVEGCSGEMETQKHLWALAERHTPDVRVDAYTQAMMDLGSLICKRILPDCLSCPLQDGCLAYQEGKVHAYPMPKPKKVKPIKSLFMLLWVFNEEILLYKRAQSGIWGGLWSLPEFSNQEALKNFCVQQGIDSENLSYEGMYRHTFTHFHLDVTPVYLQIGPSGFVREETQAWYGLHDLNQLGLPALVKKLVKEFTQHVLF